MRNIVRFFLLSILLISCDNAIQLTLPGLLTTQTPVTNPDPGLYTSDLNRIELISQTEGAEIYYTTDTTAPGPGKNRYTTPLSLSGHHSELYIRAIAYRDGKEASGEMTAQFYIEYAGPEAPSFQVRRTSDNGMISPRTDGSYGEDITVTLIPETLINDDPDSLWNLAGSTRRVIFTEDGKTPTADDFANPQGTAQTYSAQTFDVTGEAAKTLKARTVAAGFPASGLITQTFRVRYDQEITQTPQFSEPEGSKYASFNLNLTIPAGAPTGSEIRFTRQQINNGSLITTANQLYSSTLSVFPTTSVTEETITAWLVCDQWQDGPEITYHYNYSEASPQAPVIRVLRGSDEISQGSVLDYYDYIHIETDLSEGTIYYTVDDSLPGILSNVYTDPLLVVSTVNSTSNYVIINAVVVRGTMTSPIGSVWFYLP